MSTGGGSQSSLGSWVSFQWSQISRASSVSRLISGKPCAAGEPQRPLADQEAVPGALHHQSSDRGGMHDVADRGHRAAAVGRSVHDGGVELDDSVFIGEAAVAHRVVLGIGLDDRHPLDRRVQGVVPLLDQLHGFCDRL